MTMSSSRPVSSTPNRGSGQIGMVAAVSIGIGGMVGAGIFSILGVVAQAAGSAMWLAFLIGGVVLVEVVFALPGIGRYAVDSLLVNDFAPVQGFVLVVLVVYLCVNLLADVLYGLVNPQVRATME